VKEEHAAYVDECNADLQAATKAVLTKVKKQGYGSGLM
jgi:hypothetical protein